MDFPVCSLTWEKFQTKPNIITIFQDPVYLTYVECGIFLEMYGELLRTFDGSDMTSFIDFYFESSPLNNTIYIFRDEDAQLDFRDLAIELNLIPEIGEIMEGESKKEKAVRTQVSQPKVHAKKKVSTEEKVSNRTRQAQQTLDKLMAKLKEETDPRVRDSIEKKIEKTLKHLDKTV